MRSRVSFFCLFTTCSTTPQIFCHVEKVSWNLSVLQCQVKNESSLVLKLKLFIILFQNTNKKELLYFVTLHAIKNFN